ncbi:MAG TPA: SprT family zinc-dependent metalloprotease, partial [Dehalococcoidia bacterium]
VRMVVESTIARRVQIDFLHRQFNVCVPAALSGEERREAIARAFERWYRARAAEEIGRAVERWAPLAGVRPASVLVRAQRRRWGSCSATGVLRFNWRLVMTEPRLIDYVVVHELAHLRVQSHAPAFWAEVARLLPDWKLLRRRLREIGPTLSF